MKNFILDNNIESIIVREGVFVRPKFGIWSYSERHKQLYKLQMSDNSGGIVFAFYSLDGTHSGYSNHDSFYKCLKCMLELKNPVWAIETKEELIELLRDKS